MKDTNNKTTWQEIANELGISLTTLKAHRQKADSPKTQDKQAWVDWYATKQALGGRGSGQNKTIKVDGQTYTANDIARLKARLLDAQGQGELLKNRVKEIDIAQKEKDLVPRQEAQEAINSVLIPIKQGLDTMAASIAHKCNASDPAHAKEIIRQYIDKLLRGVSSGE